MKVKRYYKNPILEPDKKSWWESQGIFNPGVFYKDGVFHMLYRATGEYKDYISRIGYAKSKDGFYFQKDREPVLKPEEDYERWGLEDPRITQIEDKFYITYVVLEKRALSKGQVSSTALVSTEDFRNFQRYGIITPPNVDDRDTVLFPEKIKGKFVMLHRPLVTKSIYLAYSKDLVNWSDHKLVMRPREHSWDCFKIGAGAPPVKTEEGWLEIYHGVDENYVYRLGAVLLDLKDPSKVLARLEKPILEPEEIYEIIGDVPNVVFTCGMIEKDGFYYIYYGGADKVTNVAIIDKEELLKSISKN